MKPENDFESGDWTGWLLLILMVLFIGWLIKLCAI